MSGSMNALAGGGGIDPSIPLRAGAGVVPLQNPLDTMGKAAGIAQTLAATNNIQQNTATNANNEFQKGFSEFLMLPPQLQTQGVARQLVDSYLARGIIGPAQHHAAMVSIDSAPDHPSLINLAQRALTHAGGPAMRASTLYGENQTRDDGQQIISGGASSPMGRAVATNNGQPTPSGFVPTGGNTQTYPSRATLAGRVQTGIGPNGEPIYGPAANVTPPNLAGPAAGPMGTGRPPAALVGPGGVRPAASATPPNNGNVVTGLGPAQTAAEAGRGATANQGFQQISDQGVQARTQAAILDNMLADTAQFTTGTGSDKIKAFQNAITRVAPQSAAAFGIAPERLAANESFDKLAAQIAMAQGAGSDARLAVNQAGNPNSHMSPQGVDMILRQLRGNSDYLMARQRLAAAHPDQTDVRGFEANTGGNLDPRVFQYARLRPDQRAAYVKSLPNPSEFIGKYNWAEKNGILGGQ